MSKRGNSEFVNDIKEAMGRIISYIDKMSYEQFLQDIKTQDAVVRNLETIGEATKNLCNDFKEKYKLMPWKKLAGSRDKLIHDYFGVNYDIVWVIAKEELPELMRQVDKIIAAEEKQEK